MGFRQPLKDGRHAGVAVRRTRVLMEQALPQANVTGYAHLIAALDLPDPDDRHVLAAAIHAQARQLVTFNLKDFPPSAAQPYGVRIVHPDDWTLGVVRASPQEAGDVVVRLLAATKQPPLGVSEFCRALERLSLPRTAEEILQLML